MDWIGPAVNEPNEFAIWIIILTTAGYMIRTWWKEKLEKNHVKKVEKKIENGWTNGNDTISGKSNPGRSTAQLVEIVHEDLQIHKKETSRTLNRLIEDVGRIKGKLNIN